MRETVETQVLEAHQGFFDHFEIDCTTGLVQRPCIKFASYPHVGSEYGSMKRLLIVGMDVGWDETPGQIQTIEARRSLIEGTPLTELGPHMAGTCVMAMHLLKGERESWQGWLANADMTATPQTLLRHGAGLPAPNPLLHFAFTNYYKFLLPKTGERVQLEREREEDFLLDEVRALEPAVVLLQSAQFKHGYQKLLERLSERAEVFMSDHPSVRGERRWAGRLIKSIESSTAHSAST